MTTDRQSLTVEHRLQTMQQENTRHTTDNRQVSFELRQPFLMPVARGLLQRKCACGGTPGLDGECAECRAKRLGLRHQATNQVAVSPVPPIVHEVLRFPGQPLDATTRTYMELRFGHDFSKVRVHTDASQGLQASLTVNQPGDEYEQEADRVAEQVMRMPEPHASIVEQTYRAQPIVQRSPLTPGPSPTEGETSGVPPIVHDVLRSSGQPLDAATRAFMEPRFGHDFGQVRVHTDAKAVESARAVKALAYTVEKDVVFGAGQYEPETNEGRRLLAHELTHVVQQAVPQQIRANGTMPNNRSALTRGRNQHEVRQLRATVAPLTPGLLPLQIQRQQDICTLPTEVISGDKLSQEELEDRRKKIQEAINGTKGIYPLAAANLQHWLDNSGTDRRLSLSDVNFASEDSGVPRYLRDVHRERIALKDKGNNIQGITRRLDRGHPETLYPAGEERVYPKRVLRWQETMRPELEREGVRSPGLEVELSFALGGFTVSSEVTVRAKDPSPGTVIKEVEVLSWSIQICDLYNFKTDTSKAIIPVPIGIEVPPIPEGAGGKIGDFPRLGYQLFTTSDSWYNDVEVSGGAKQYRIFSDIFDAPESVRASFKVEDDKAKP
jgi:hypothetical protein